jgi:hypothetical protein
MTEAEGLGVRKVVAAGSGDILAELLDFVALALQERLR